MRPWERRLDRTDEVRSGIGSSGLDDCSSSGRKGAYGLSCSRSFETKTGMSGGRSVSDWQL